MKPDTDRSGEQAQPPSIRRSLVLSFAQKYTALLISVPTIMALSRLLTPAEVGIYSVAVAFVNIVHMLRDFGTSDYLIQERELDTAAARSAFTITLIIAWTLGAMLFLGSHWIALFFREEGLRLVLQVLSINFILLPFGSTTNALLMRDMQYGIRYRINTGQQLARSGVTLSLALLGFGYMSPAWGSVAGMSATVAGCMVWGRHYRIRGLGLDNWRAVADFGLKKSVGSIVGRLGESAPDFVIGRMLGFTSAGLFSRGAGLVRLFRQNVIGAIGAVAYSAYAQRHRSVEGPQGLYLKSMTFVTGISWPFFAFAALMALPIIRIMFGDQWDAAVPIMRLLSIQGLIGMTFSHSGELLTAIGRVGIATQRTVVMQIVNIAVMVLAATYSLWMVAAATVPVGACGAIYTGFALVRYAGLSWAEIVEYLKPSAILTASSMVLPLLIYVIDTPSIDNLWSPLLLSMAGATAGWLIGLRLGDHPLHEELRAVLSRMLAGRKRLFAR